MKAFYLSVLGLILCTQAGAQTLVHSEIVTKGVTYKKYTMTGPNQEIHVLQVDLTDPTIKLQSVKASDVLSGTKQTVKQMAAAKDVNEQYHNVLGGINGDFYDINGTQNPNNVTVLDGMVLASKYFKGKKKSVFGISNTNDPFITKLKENYRVFKGGVSRKIDSINRSRGTNNLILYNRFKGATTGTNTFGTELLLRLAPNQTWKVNGQVQCIVDNKKVLQAGMAIPLDKVVLSGNGSSKTYLDSFAVGDPITLDLSVDSTATLSNTVQITGGYPQILTNGANSVLINVPAEGGSSSDNTTPDNPHTGIGISQDEHTLYMVVVDGRAPGLRNGMTLEQFSDLMSALGAYNAINLDGGWSSTLVANNVLKNTPSDASGLARDISSSLLVWSATMLMDDFEGGEGHFLKTPKQGGSVGIKSTSTLDRVTTGPYSGVGCERAVLIDSTQIATNWVVRLMSGDGVPSGNTPIASNGTFSVWLKTSTAQAGAKVYLRFDESTTVTEETPGLTIINDGNWHQYNFDLNYTSGGTSIVGGNGVLADMVTFESIILKQNNTSTTWTVYFDEITHNPAGSGTTVNLMATNESSSSQSLLAEPVTEMKVAQELPDASVVYPNPNNGTFTLDLKEENIADFTYTITDLQGNRLASGKGNNGKENISIAGVPDGIYLINVKSGKLLKYFRLIVKK